jgi:hypothetical protein
MSKITTNIPSAIKCYNIFSKCKESHTVIPTNISCCLEDYTSVMATSTMSSACLTTSGYNIPLGSKTGRLYDSKDPDDWQTAA